MAQPIFDMDAANAALKVLYIGQNLKNAVYTNQPALAWMPKVTRFGGKFMPLPVNYNVGAGASNTFSNTLANQQAPEPIAFDLTTVEGYSVAQVSGRVVKQSMTDTDSFVRAIKFAVDQKILGARNQIAQQIWGARDGLICSFTSLGAGVMQLADSAGNALTSAGVFFNVGDVLNAFASNGTTARAGVGIVLSVNREAGRITVADYIGSPTVAAVPSGWVSTDRLVINGNYNRCMSGVPSWIPRTEALAATTLFGVDRSVDTTKLAGIRYDGTSMTITQALINGAARIAQEDGAPDTCFMNWTSYAAFTNEIQSRSIYESKSHTFDGVVGFEGIELRTPTGKIQVFADRNVPAKTAYLLQKDTWALYSADTAPFVDVNDQGAMLDWVPTADAYQVRIKWYAQVGCNNPAKNGVVLLSN